MKLSNILLISGACILSVGFYVSSANTVEFKTLQNVSESKNTNHSVLPVALSIKIKPMLTSMKPYWH